MNETFGSWLREARQAARISMDTLAERAGCSKSYVHRIERGIGHPVTGAPPRPTRAVVESLARALDASPSEALRAAGYLPDEMQLTDDDEITIANYKELSADAKQAATLVIRSLHAQYHTTHKDEQP